MCACAVVGTSGLAAGARASTRASRVSVRSFSSSRRNGQSIKRPSHPTQLAAIQVLEPEEEISTAADLFEDDDSEPAGLSTQQVQTLLSVICNDTELAEIELQIGSFDLKVRRSIAGNGASTSSPSAPSFPGVYGSPFVSTQSMDQGDYSPPPPAPSSESQPSVDEDDDDGSTVYVESHKVGFFRRGRYVKGKKVGKGPIAEVGTKVKKGQVVAFVEQLGTFVPIETQQAGEIAAFVVEEGASVEYKQPLVEIAPFFGGHIIGDKKLA